MTREESKMMQGVAILIMIFYHLFNVGEYSNTFVGNLAKANNPVPFYVFFKWLWTILCLFERQR